MSAFSAIQSSTTSLAVPDDEADILIIGRRLNKATRDKLRARGEWPPVFYVGRRAFVLRYDIETFLEQRKAAAAKVHAELSDRGRRAVETRWRRHRGAQHSAVATK